MSVFRIPNEHVVFLMSSYQTDPRPSVEQKTAIAGALGMSTEQVVNWFKKQRLREPRKAATNFTFTKAQYAELKQKFEANPRPTCKEIGEWADAMGVTYHKLNKWFSRQRTEARRKGVVFDDKRRLTEQEAVPIFMEILQKVPDFDDYDNTELRKATEWSKRRIRTWFRNYRLKMTSADPPENLFGLLGDDQQSMIDSEEDPGMTGDESDGRSSYVISLPDEEEQPAAPTRSQTIDITIQNVLNMLNAPNPAPSTAPEPEFEVEPEADCVNLPRLDMTRRKQLHETRTRNFHPFFRTTYLPFNFSTIYTSWTTRDVQEFLCQFLPLNAMRLFKGVAGLDLDKIRFDNPEYFQMLNEEQLVKTLKPKLTWVQYLDIERQINEIKSYNNQVARFRASLPNSYES
ncbi:unnamed protein product [Caenorhabditis nigoni]